MRNLSKILLAAIVLFQVAACADSNQNSSSEKNGILGFFSSDESNDLSYESMTDPNENAFTIDVPKGWNSRISLERFNTITRQCGVTVSPDNKTRVFFGDPSIPNFVLPEPSIGLYENGPFDTPTSQLRQFVSDENFMSDYTKMAYGRSTSIELYN